MGAVQSVEIEPVPGGPGRSRLRNMRVMLGVNVGCGPHPIDGWVNVDNSPTLLLRSLPVGRMLDPGRRAVWTAARESNVKFGTAVKLPVADGVADTVYSSHMLEHLSRENARRFLRECRRVLKPGGWLRISIPDLAKLTDDYLRDGDGDRFVSRLMLSHGRRGHKWMYDERSLKLLLLDVGFDEVVMLPPGKTNLVFHDGLDLHEREVESLYVEAMRSA